MASADRFEDLVDYPRESLEVELKTWLDLGVEADRANVAQALLALANHGGGFVVLGLEERDGGWHRAAGGPPDESAYNQDTVNEIAKKYADPPFHCEVRRVVRDAPHLVIVVPGGQRVPVRARAGGPDNRHVKKDTYYIRRPGPESAPIQSGAEWDALLRRCLQAAKDEIADLIRAAMGGVATVPAVTTEMRLAEWVEQSRGRLQTLIREELAHEKPNRYALGTWSFAYALDEPVVVSLAELEQTMNQANGHITGWPAFIMFTRDDFAPYPHDGAIEAWVHEKGVVRQGSHSDFWRASTDGRLFLLRGYQEDDDVQKLKPGTAIDRGLPIWRMGECLLHVQRFAQLVGRSGGRVVVQARWTGLKGRELGEHMGNWPMGPDSRACRQDEVTTVLTLDAGSIRAKLGEHVKALTEPLYSAFGFAAVDRTRIDHELSVMLRNK
jgi:hypothetical protein